MDTGPDSLYYIELESNIVITRNVKIGVDEVQLQDATKLEDSASATRDGSRFSFA
jgi:hypothetical protein